MGGRPIDATDDHRDLTGGISAATGEKGSEVWTYYNLFSTLQKPQVVELMFVDSDGTGNYRLVTNLQQLIPGGIDSLLKPDMELTHELYKEENLRTRRGRWVLFDFDWEFLKQEDTAAGSNLAVSVSLPHRRIVFEVEGERLRAELRLTIQVRDAAGKTVGAASFEDRLELERSALEEDPNARWTASVPVTPRLAKGRYRWV